MLAGRGIEALLMFIVLLVFFVIFVMGAEVNDEIGMLVFVSLIVVVVVFGMFRVFFSLFY